MWYDKYLNLPYLHLGDNPNTGIDCLNLIKLIYKQELNIELPYNTANFCNDINPNWYSRLSNTKFVNPFLEFNNKKWGWLKVESIIPYDVIIMFLGSSNIPNHCALYLGDNKILNIMINKPSWLAIYGNYYKQYTEGIYRYDNK